jgi:hypothetical protein
MKALLSLPNKLPNDSVKSIKIWKNRKKGQYIYLIFTDETERKNLSINKKTSLGLILNRKSNLWKR